ncbi:MAG: HAMP domain-containing protein [Deltaproteobacteria bacterium]|nr:HAMP domain-containing protein [Deltaproteobacteria bacterium]
MANKIIPKNLFGYRGPERREGDERRKSLQPITTADLRSGKDRRDRRRLPIFAKLSILSALQMLLVVSIISLTMLAKQKQQYIDQLIDFGVDIVKIAAHNSPDKLLSEEEVSLFQLVKDISENEQVRFAMIVDTRKRIVAHSQFERVNTTYSPPENLELIDERDETTISSFTDGGEPLLHFRQPITYQKLQVGIVVLALTQQTLFDTIREATIFILVLTVVILAIGLATSVFVSLYFSRPIVELKKSAQVLGRGNFSYRLNINRNDELGDLGKAFNQMAAGLGERELIRETFGKYVSPEIRDRILSGDIPLNGERREATLLFSDLRGFTAYVEKNEPEEVIQSMRAYFSVMEAAIKKHGGLVLQYVGDEIEAVFGIPITVGDHAERAMLAALDMRQALIDLNRERAASDLPPFKHGIGIYTGKVLAGNTGSDERLSYTLIGNTVNLASRIQGMTKEIGWDILAHESTLERTTRPFNVVKEDQHKVKGYSKSIIVYRLIGD